MGNTYFAKMQQLGRSLMLPIAVLPIAGLLLRLGQPDLLNVKILAQAGEAVFSNLALLFAVGVAVGFARENAGVAGLAGGLGYIVMMAVLKTLNDKINPGVLPGILAGLIAGALYNRYKDISLPDYLAFFGGKRFVPIVSGVACLAVALPLGVFWPPIQNGIDHLGHWLFGAGVLGLFVYGVLNRLLLITGLHHILNSLVWFVFGHYDTGGKVVTGDLHRFFAADPTAGGFMTGYFPVMMFGLPAACLAMYRAAPPENRKTARGLLVSMALTSFLTGITEPVEFSFMFLAPSLYAVHAVLTGLSMALMNALGVRLGFTFSAGTFDFVLSYGLSSKGWLLFPVGLFTFAVYYAVFTVGIRRFGLATPGRELSGEATRPPPLAQGKTERARAFVAALGGKTNLLSVDACTTRLRLALASNALVDRRALKSLGAKGVLFPAPGSVQVVLGPEADIVGDSIRAVLSQPSEACAAAGAGTGAAAWLVALGGEQNLRALESVATTRLRVVVADASLVDDSALQQLGAQGVVRLSSTLVHVIVGPGSKELAAAIHSRRPQ